VLIRDSHIFTIILRCAWVILAARHSLICESGDRAVHLHSDSCRHTRRWSWRLTASTMESRATYSTDWLLQFDQLRPNCKFMVSPSFGPKIMLNTTTATPMEASTAFEQDDTAALWWSISNV